MDFAFKATLTSLAGRQLFDGIPWTQATSINDEEIFACLLHVAKMTLLDSYLVEAGSPIIESPVRRNEQNWMMGISEGLSKQLADLREWQTTLEARIKSVTREKERLSWPTSSADFFTRLLSAVTHMYEASVATAGAKMKQNLMLVITQTMILFQAAFTTHDASNPQALESMAKVRAMQGLLPREQSIQNQPRALCLAVLWSPLTIMMDTKIQNCTPSSHLIAIVSQIGIVGGGSTYLLTRR